MSSPVHSASSRYVYVLVDVCMCACVCVCVLLQSNNNGNNKNIPLQILTQLDPTHTRSLDIASYFQLCKDQTQGRRDRGGGEEQEEGGEGELLPQVPVAGLKKSLSRRGKKKTGMGKCVSRFFNVGFFF